MLLNAHSLKTTLWETLMELSIDEALQLAVRMHREGELDHAETLYRRILSALPEHPDALHFLGILLHQRGRNEAAIAHIEKSIALDHTHPGRFNNLGNVLLELERHEQAAAAYRRAIELDPQHADAYNNLGALLRAQGHPAQAHDAYLKAIELNPEHVDAYNNLGNLFSGQGKTNQAVACYCKAITLMPNHPEAKRLLGIAYCTLGQIDKAAGIFAQWIKDEPDNPIAHHLYAASSQQNVPARASDAYIESTFDGFAESFEAKLGKLGYRAPELVVAALAAACSTPARQLTVLDAGCGTGLCGPLIAPYARRLIGVDLSSGMLQRARARGIYDELVKAELQDFLADHVDEFDIIISADTLVYFGALERVFHTAFRALKPGGLLAFSVEEGHDAANGYQINPHGRYSHERSYLRRAMAQVGFEEMAVKAAELRKEGGKPVAGLVVSGRKALVFIAN